jgi:hypothetical protein
MVEVVAGQRLARGKGDGVDQPVETVPMAAQVGEHLVDLRIGGDIAVEHAVGGAEGAGQIHGTLTDALALAGEGQFGALAVRRSSDAVGD